MEISLDKALKTVATLALCVIAVQIIPFSRYQELKNLCVEASAGSWATKEKMRLKKIRIIMKKANLPIKGDADNDTATATEYCNHFFDYKTNKFGFWLLDLS